LGDSRTVVKPGTCRIAVVADTHGRVPDHIRPALRKADEIWHLGDFCEARILRAIHALGPPVRAIAGNNTIFAKASYGWIDGSNTEDNAHFSGVVALSHEFAVRGFEYVTVGPAVSYESFENNQNHFTYGHGGYFSPQSLLQGIIQAQFLTKEGSRWLAAGMAGVGVQTNEQDSAPFFPLRPDGRNYSSESSTTGIGLIDVTGAYLINPNWLIGGSAGFNVTADYNEGFINIWVRYYFERRNGLVRDDLGLQGLTPVY
jgi:predicted phosphodiesterase